MHDIDINFDLSLNEIAKIEGAASLDLRVEHNKITDLRFSISEWKRFYTQAIRGKPAVAIPQLVARICGTCSNAHLLAAIKTVETAFNIQPSVQTQRIRKLLFNGLIIRDHALHLYIFSLPDYFKKNSILDFDMTNTQEAQLLDDAFSVKEVGNQLSIVCGGRSVHAPFVTLGGFLKLPEIEAIKSLKKQLLDIRPKILRLISIFESSDAKLDFKDELVFTSLISKDFSFIEGNLQTADGTEITENNILNHLNAIIIPYSQARGFTFQGKKLMVGALARLNLSQETLHPQTRQSLSSQLKKFPTKNLFLNNLAQAIEIVQAIDASCDIIDSLTEITKEAPVPVTPRKTETATAIEAPRGTLYYKLAINDEGIVTHGDIIVPTGQNQIVMETGIRQIVEALLMQNATKEEIVYRLEEFIRAFDPCMSCASHFLKVKWL